MGIEAESEKEGRGWKGGKARGSIGPVQEHGVNIITVSHRVEEQS